MAFSRKDPISYSESRMGLVMEHITSGPRMATSTGAVSIGRHLRNRIKSTLRPSLMTSPRTLRPNSSSNGAAPKTITQKIRSHD